MAARGTAGLSVRGHVPHVGMYRGNPVHYRVWASHFIETGTRYFYGT
ncbi:hypothetical protein [Streptomyces sp. NPDC001020]